jgi:hypothetical protein
MLCGVWVRGDDYHRPFLMKPAASMIMRRIDVIPVKTAAPTKVGTPVFVARAAMVPETMAIRKVRKIPNMPPPIRATMTPVFI